MSNWYKLELPLIPLRSDVSLKNFTIPYEWNIYTNPLDLLADDVKQIFYDLNVEPVLIVIFNAMESTRTISYLHKDLTWQNNHWQTVPCAINWELQPTQTTVKWYHTDNCKEYWPKTDFNTAAWPYKYLNSIGYMPDYQPGVPVDAVLLQQAEVEQTAPILFRTDVAHSVQFQSQLPYRFMCSVRFGNIHSWDHALEVFQEVIVDSN